MQPANALVRRVSAVSVDVDVVDLGGGVLVRGAAFAPARHEVQWARPEVGE
jgi:hypothetical protein